MFVLEATASVLVWTTICTWNWSESGPPLDNSKVTADRFIIWCKMYSVCLPRERKSFLCAYDCTCSVFCKDYRFCSSSKKQLAAICTSRYPVFNNQSRRLDGEKNRKNDIWVTQRNGRGNKLIPWAIQKVSIISNFWQFLDLLVAFQLLLSDVSNSMPFPVPVTWYSPSLRKTHFLESHGP
jgi:hypothetical protein